MTLSIDNLTYIVSHPQRCNLNPDLILPRTMDADPYLAPLMTLRITLTIDINLQLIIIIS